MDVGDFWRIIETSQDEVGERQLAKLRAALDGLDASQRAGFGACFAALMRYACDWRLWDASAITYAGMDERTFFGVRAWLISRGSDTYHGILADPDALARDGVALFPEFARVAAGKAEDPDRFGVHEFTFEPIDHDDEVAVRTAFPALWTRYRAPAPRVARQVRGLFTPSEWAAHVRNARVSALVGVGCCALAMWWLPWWGAAPACVGLVSAWVWFAALGQRRIVGGFVSRARALGNADRLVGDVHVAVVHAHPVAGRFPPTTEAPVAQALSFLTDEAKRHGVVLRFRYTPPDPIVLETPRLYDAEFRDYMPSSIEWLEDTVADLMPAGNAFALVITSETACVPTAWHASRFRPAQLEFCVCPANATVMTIAHEILHLFGALDLYRPTGPGGRTCDDVAREVAAFIEQATGENVRETSVMTNREAPDLRVDPATAHAVGWTDRVAGRIVPQYHRR